MRENQVSFRTLLFFNFFFFYQKNNFLSATLSHFRVAITLTSYVLLSVELYYLFSNEALYTRVKTIPFAKFIQQWKSARIRKTSISARWIFSLFFTFSRQSNAFLSNSRSKLSSCSLNYFIFFLQCIYTYTLTHYIYVKEFFDKISLEGKREPTSI